MICPVCEEEGLKSHVRERGTYTTAMAADSYYDEEGNYVANDPNTRTTDYDCSRGHRFVKISHRGESRIEVREARR